MNYRIITFIFLTFSLISIGMVWHTNNLQENVVITSGLDNAKIYSDAITAFRTIYTSEVITAAKQHGVQVTHDYKNRKAIPLPATLSILLGNKIGEGSSGVSVSLYSPYPFSWRKKGKGLSDNFGKKAWESFLSDASKPYYKFYLNRENNVLRYAVADEMRASCINCHNSRPDSPKTNWKVGDVRGILEVSIPLNNVIANTKNDLFITIIIYSFLSVLGMSGTIFMFKKHKEEIKTLEGIIPICSYCHNIRSDEGAWDRIEAYISKHSEAEFSHGICPDCLVKARSDAGLDKK